MFLTNSSENTLASTIRDIRHDLLLNFSEKSLFEYATRSSQLHIELPYPIHKPMTRTTKDTVKEFIETKKEYNKQLDNKRRSFVTEKKNIVREYIGSKKYLHIPRHFWEFYNRDDPDPYFNSDYNCYYTGGALECIECDNKQYLIRPNIDGDLQACNLIDHENVSLNFHHASVVYGLDSTRKASNTFILSREKHKINVGRLSYLENIEISTKWSKNNKSPIFDAKFLQSNPSHIGVISADPKFTVIDIDADKDIYNFKSNFVKFPQFQSLGEQLFVIIDGFNIKIIDSRANEVENYKLDLLACNPVCTFKVLDNSVLLASRHYIMKCDLRHLNNLSYYSHSLVTPPTYLDYVQKGNETYLCVAGQDTESKVLFTGCSAYSLPFKVPGILATLREINLKHPKTTLLDFQDTLNFSTTGLQILDVNGEICIYSTNCSGEIFKQKISNNEIPTENALKYLLEWINDSELDVPPLNLTHKIDMTEAWMAITRNLDKNDSNLCETETKLNTFLAKFGERFSKKNMKGIVARDFENVWNEGEDDESSEEVENLPEVPVYDKVTNWMQMSDFMDEPSSSNIFK